MMMFQAVRYDLRRHCIDHLLFLQKIEKIIFTPGIWATVIYRVGNWVQSKVRPAWARKILMIPIRFLHLLICVPIGIDISVDATIGKGLYIGHFGGIVINSNVV